MSMSKRDKTIVGGVVAGVVVLGGIGAIMNKEEVPNAVAETTPAIIETVAEVSTETFTEETTIVITSEQKTEPPKTEPEKTEPPVTSAPIVTEPPAPIVTTSNNSGNHFNDYDNPGQQNTVEYVLNTDTLKVHKPSCNDVKKIKPENYSTTTDLNWAKNQGYTACGHCHPF